MRPRTYALAFVALAALLTAPLCAGAQLDALKNTTPEQRATLQTDLMKARLDLTADEEPKIAALNLKYAQKMDPIIKSSAGMFSKMRDMRALNAQKEAELKQLLSKDQFTAYLAAREDIRQEFEARIAAHAGAAK
jgi:hypothetical protein